jgi:hypothetical protein
MNEPPPRLSAVRRDVPPELDRVVQSCLAKERDLRCPDVASLARQLAPFGGPAALESAERVARIRYGGIATSSVTSMTVAQQPHISARSRISGDDLVPDGIRPPRKGYALAALACLAVLGDVGWQVAHRAEATRAPPAHGAEQVTATLVPTADVLVPTAPTVPTVAPTVPSEPPPAAPAKAATTPLISKSAPRAQPHRSPRRVTLPTRPHEPMVPEPKPSVDPPAPPAAPSPEATAPPASPAADDVFEDRK